MQDAVASSLGAAPPPNPGSSRGTRGRARGTLPLLALRLRVLVPGLHSVVFSASLWQGVQPQDPCARVVLPRCPPAILIPRTAFTMGYYLLLQFSEGEGWKQLCLHISLFPSEG